MEDSSYVRVRRQAESADPPERRAHTLQWRKIALLMTPAVLAAGNLVSAHFERKKAIKVGDIKYEEFRGKGEAIRNGVLRAAKNRGELRYRGMIAEAENQAKKERATGKREEETRLQEGLMTGRISKALSDNYIKELYGRMPELEALIHDVTERTNGLRTGIYLTVDLKTAEVKLQRFDLNQQDDAEFKRNSRALREKERELYQMKEEIVARATRTAVMTAGVIPCSPPLSTR
jgi:hypothetical protein